MIDQNVYTFLSAQAGITSIVSTRIYPLILPSSPAYPAVTYRDEGHDPAESFTGSDELTRSDYFIDAWSSTPEGATTLETAIKTALKNHSGAFGGITILRSTISTIQGMVYEDSVEAYRKTVLFTIWHQEG